MGWAVDGILCGVCRQNSFHVIISASVCLCMGVCVCGGVNIIKPSVSSELQYFDRGLSVM